MARIFSGPSDTMLAGSRTVRQQFIDNKTDFTSEDTDFADPFDANWLTAIELAEAQVSAETRDDQLKGKTDTVMADMEAARDKIGEARYFIRKAFKTKPAVQEEFGLDDYNEIRASQAGMVIFLKNLHSLANGATYKPALLTAKWTQLKIDAILTIKNALSADNTAQDAFAQTETVATKARDAVYNAAYLFWVSVGDFAKVIYRNNPELLNLFLRARGDEPDTVFNLVGNASAQGTGNQIANVQCKLIPGNIIRTTNAAGQFGFAAIAAGAWQLQFSAVGYVPQTVSFTITDAGTPTVVNVVMVAL